MKTCFLFLIVSAFLNFAHAEDQIEVTVNGKTYSCSESGSSSGIKSGCICFDTGSTSATLKYISIDLKTGENVTEKFIADWSGTFSAMTNCEEYKKTYFLCQLTN